MRTPSPGLFDPTFAVHRGMDRSVLESLVCLAIEIAREGREGRKIGTLFTLGDSDEVLARSEPLILDPLAGHPVARKRLDDPNMRETVKELAQLDGAFVVSHHGVVLSACRYLDASATGIRLPLGFGSRHMAAAAITKCTRATAVVVSQSSFVRVFDDGELVSEIVPEVWMLHHFTSQIEGPATQRSEAEVTVVSKAE